MYPTKANKQSLAVIPKPLEDLERATGAADRFLRQREVLPLSGFGSQSTLKIKIKNGEFPAPIKISEGRQAWSEREVIEWQQARIADRDAIVTKRNGIKPEREPNRSPEPGGHSVSSSIAGPNLGAV